MPIRNPNDTWEKYKAVMHSLSTRLGKLAKLEIDYGIEHSRRLLTGKRKSSNREALLLNQIRCVIQECKKIEQAHNRYSIHQIEELDSALFNTSDYPKSRELVLKQIKYASVAQSNWVAKRKAIAKDIKQIEADNTTSGSNSTKVLERYFKENAEVHKAIESSRNTIGDILKQAPKTPTETE